MGKINYIEQLEEWRASFGEPHYETIVRFCETDMFGHLNNTVPLVYFEAARIRFFQQLGLMDDWTNPLSDAMPVVADLQCDFIRQVFFDEVLKVYVKVHRIGNSSIDLHYMVQNGQGELCLTGRGAMVQISKKTGKGIKWTDEMKQCLMA
jgi:acyl-CoA thioester hydrolase